MGLHDGPFRLHNGTRHATVISSADADKDENVKELCLFIIMASHVRNR